jgi:hypothetical protein
MKVHHTTLLVLQQPPRRGGLPQNTVQQMQSHEKNAPSNGDKLQRLSPEMDRMLKKDVTKVSDIS